jgi:hypothetical protein
MQHGLFPHDGPANAMDGMLGGPEPAGAAPVLAIEPRAVRPGHPTRTGQIALPHALDGSATLIGMPQAFPRREALLIFVAWCGNAHQYLIPKTPPLGRAGAKVQPNPSARSHDIPRRLRIWSLSSTCNCP